MSPGPHSLLPLSACGSTRVRARWVGAALLLGAAAAPPAHAHAHAQDGMERGGVVEGEPPHGGCGTAVDPAHVPQVRALEARGLHRLPAPPELVFQVPMTFHIVRRSDGTGGPTVAALDGDVPVLNAAFPTTGVQFFRTGAVKFIDSDLFYNGITTQIEADVLRNTGAVPNTINVFFVKDFIVNGRSLCGQSSFTTDVAQGILMDTDCMPNTGNPTTLIHEFGHYFDLYHTHETAFGVECPDGTNCFSAGDLLCDTPADPNVSGLTTNCLYTGTVTACGGQTYGNPPVTNFMSAGPRTCRTVFTALQRARMAATLVNLRSNLLGAQASVVWVDFDHNGFEFGSYAAPFNTLAEALGVAGSGATIVMREATTSETGLVAQPVLLDAFGGPARLGS